MVKVLRLNNNSDGTPIFTEATRYATQPLMGKILKIYVDVGDCPLVTVRMTTTEDERIMDREFQESGAYKPLDVLQEGSSYDRYYSAGSLIVELLGSVSKERPVKEIRIFYE